MKTTMWIAGGLAAAVLVFSGCGKSKQGPEAPPARPAAVNVPKLRDACASGNAEVQSGASRVIMAIRMNNYASALAELDKLAANPTLTEAQKRAVSEVSEQVKHNLAQTPTGPSR